MVHMFHTLFGSRNFNLKLWRMTLPSTLQQLMLALVAAGDAFMLGKVDQNSMAAVSLATQVQFVQNTLLWAIVSGIGILGAQYWGKRDTVILDKIFGSSVREAFAVSFVFFIGCFIFPEYLMRVFAHDPLLVSIGAEYLRLAGWSYLITGVSQCYLAVMRVSGHIACSAWISSGAVVLNIIFNALLIFGLCGLPAMGVRGAALATVLARIAELICCIAVSGRCGFIPLKIRTVLQYQWKLIAEFWRYALPLLGASLLWGIGFTAYTAIMGHLGRDAAAANSIAAVVRDLMCCICAGVAIGGGILIGNELGAGNLKRGRLFGSRLMAASLLIGGFSAAVVLMSLPLVSDFMKLTPLAQHYMKGMFMILAVYMIGRCVCTVVINGIFDAGGDTAFDIYSLAVCMWGIALPCAFLGAFYFELPVLVVYSCTCLDEVGKVPWVLWHFRQYKWVRNITRSDLV